MSSGGCPLGAGNLFAINRRDAATNKTVVHVLNGATGFSTFAHNFVSVLGPTDDGRMEFAAADYTRDGIVDVLAINRRDAATNKTVVHVLNGATGFSTFAHNFVSVLGPTDDGRMEFAAADYTRDGIVDVLAINRRDAATNKTVVHVLNGATGFSTFAHNFVSVLGPTDDGRMEFAAADYTRDGIVDVLAINRRDAATNKTVVHVLNGATGFSTFAHNFVSVLGPTDDGRMEFAAADYTRDGIVDVLAINRRDAATNKTVVHVLNGATGFSTFAHNFVSVLGPTDDGRTEFAAG